VREILTQLLGINVGHDFREAFGRAVLHRPHDAEQHPAGNAAPRAIRQPRLTFETCFAFDVALA
jgi:hypothetical protein